MKIVADTHTHTLASGHAYSTIQEMAKAASDIGLEVLAITDHGPSIPAINNFLYFVNMNLIPDEIYGVHILKGCEVSIIDYNGKLDLEDSVIKRLDFVIASMHAITIDSGTVEENTNAVIEALRNPFVDAVGHPDNPSFTLDYEAVVKCAKEYDKLIELNEASFRVRKGGEGNAYKLAHLAKEHGVKLCVGSDAHFSTYVGNFSKVNSILEEVNMSEELVLNTSKQRVIEYISKRRKNS